MGLNSVYEPVRSQLLHREKLPGLEEAIGAIRKEESRFRVTPDPQVHNSAALLTKKPEARVTSSENWTPRPPQQSPTPGAEGEDSRDALFCTYCKKRRHTKENCWKLAWKNQNIGKKAYVSTSSSGGPRPSPNVDEVKEKLSSTALVQSGNSSPQEWIADTGATDHMSPAETLFRQYAPAERQHRIQTAGGGTLPVKGVGEILLNPLGILKEVLHVENLRANLISLQRLVDDYGWRFILDSDDCFLCDKVSGTRISSFKREGGLLLLDASPRRCLVSQLTSSKEERVTRLHQRMGHPPFDLLRTCYPSMFRGVLDEKLFCNACHMAKLRRTSFKYLNDRCLSPFECIHSDVWGPCPVESLTGCRYFVIFVDDYSRTMWLHLLKSKAEVPQILIHFCNMISNQFGKKIKRFRTDNGTEFLNSEIRTHFLDNGIIHESSCVNTPQQNGLAERRLGYTLATARSLLLQANLSKKYWGEAVLTAAHLINRIPMKVIQYDNPLSRLKTFFPKAKLFSGLPARVFGCVAFVHQNSGKLDPRGLRCVFVGYSSTQKGYRCYYPPSRKFFVSADVVFNEAENYYASEISSETAPPAQEQVDFEFLRNVGSGSLWSQELTPREDDVEAILDVHPLDDHPENPPLVEAEGEGLETENSETAVDEEHDPESSNETLAAATPEDEDLGWPIALRKGVRSCRANVKYPISNYVKYEKLSNSYRSFLTVLGDIPIPNRVEEALQDPGWRAAMNEEMTALEKNNTWELTTLPRGKKAIGCRWVFTPKFQADSTLERLKARLVAKIYTQQQGIDYGETFAPVAKFNTVRVLIALAAKCEWDILQLDVKNAFLHGELQEEVYMQLPPGYQLTNVPNQVCKLKKALYGLKQSPRAWFSRFTKAMIDLNYHQARGDHVLFIKHSTTGAVTLLLVYVDDILITGGDAAEIHQLTTALSGQFEMKELGQLKYFLGIEVAYSKEGISLSQHKYTLDLLQETGQLGCKPTSTPLDVNVKIGKGDDGAAVDKAFYQRLIGKLIYLNHTRPDISYGVSLLSQFMSEPYEVHLRAAYRILSYLKFTVGQGLLFTREGGLSLEGYTDSDWAGSVIDRRCTSGYCTFLGGSLITWRSKKQKEVSLSSAEAELRALKRGVSECRWLKHLLEDIGVYEDSGIKLYCDNQSALAIARNPVQHDRTKHMAMNRHYLSENIDRGIIRPVFVPSAEQKADIFTKPLPGPRFQLLVSKLGMVNIHA